MTQLTATLYGDFNLQTNPGTDSDDVDFFNDAYCKEIGDTGYNPLVDWNCDGVVNDCDRSQFMDNWDSDNIADECCEHNTCGGETSCE